MNSSAEVNCAQLVGTQEGHIVVPTYDWTGFLRDHFIKIPQLKSYHHFIFDAACPGRVTLKEHSDSQELTIEILSSDWTPLSHDLPPTITPTGLSSNRQWYLFQQIREFCREGTQDLTCPRPTLPPPTCEESMDLPLPQTAEDATPQQRRCGNCREHGHTRRTCPHN